MIDSDSELNGFKTRLFKKLKTLRQRSGITLNDSDLIFKEVKKNNNFRNLDRDTSLEFSYNHHNVVIHKIHGKTRCMIIGGGDFESYDINDLYYLFILSLCIYDENIDYNRTTFDTHNRIILKITDANNNISIKQPNIPQLRNSQPIELQGGVNSDLPMEGGSQQGDSGNPGSSDIDTNPNPNVDVTLNVDSIANVTGVLSNSRSSTMTSGLDMTTPEDNLDIDELFNLIKTPGTIDIGGSTFAQALMHIGKFNSARQKAFAFAFCMLFVLKPKKWIIEGRAKGRSRALEGDQMTAQEANVAARYLPMKTDDQMRADLASMSDSERRQFDRARAGYGPFQKMNRNLTIVIGLLGFEIFYDRQAHPNIMNYVEVFKHRYGARPMEITDENVAYHNNPRDTNRDISNEEAQSIMENRKYLMNLFQNGYANYKATSGL
jgi:hypothetical protein